MPRKMNILAKARLRPEQYRTVADSRFEDAEALRQTGRNARANGAMYLGGFAVECLLKAKLIERFPWLRNAGSPEGRTSADRRIWSLCYRSHDLEEILANLPDVEDRLSELGQRECNRLRQSLRSVCARWTVHARYSPHTSTIAEATEFLDQVKELKSWLQ